MAEIRCPRCGELNPADSQVCQYCRASLEQLPLSSAPEEAAPGGREFPPQSGVDEPEPGFPEWLSDLRSDPSKREERPQVDYPQDASSQEDEDLDVPAWLQRIRARHGGKKSTLEHKQPFPQEEKEELEILSSADFPDWIKDHLAREGDQQISAEPGAEQAALPSWLEAMRPMDESSLPIMGEPDRTESAGPLAGIQGVLSAGAGISRPQKPPAYSVKLRVTANQRLHADLLKELLDSEGAPIPIPRRRAISSQHVLRWGIAIILFLAVLWPLIANTQLSPLPGSTNEVTEVSQLIDQLPVDSRVLVAFDYEPGLSGELDAAGEAVVDHLMLRGAYLTLVSTSPIGPILAERFIKGMQSTHAYFSAVQYVNLGYIPGGATGLHGFAASPQAILPNTMEGDGAWGKASRPALPPLQGIHGVADFSMVMVMVDDPDTARAWVEQVQPYLVGTMDQVPLVMVTSAQVEPLIWPYFESSPKQVQGLVIGLRGGAAYAGLTGRSALPRRYWDAYGLGLLVAAVIILAGGILNTDFSDLIRRSKGKSGGKG